MYMHKIALITLYLFCKRVNSLVKQTQIDVRFEYTLYK